jgi:Domain of unknown function (DUF6249)
MKRLLSVCSIAALATAVFAQTPSPTEPSSPTPTASVTAAPGVTASPTSDLAEKIQQRIEQKFGGHHGIIIDTDDLDRGKHGDIPEQVFPIVAICMLAVFGAPVVIVALAGMFVFSATRQRHRTIRMMVEKGQPVPPELLMPPTRALRQRSDMRRGVILLMIGIGVTAFSGTVTGWDSGVWTLGLIPLLIGAGYLLVWKLEGGSKGGTDNPPLLP